MANDKKAWHGRVDMKSVKKVMCLQCGDCNCTACLSGNCCAVFPAEAFDVKETDKNYRPRNKK